MSLRTRLGLAVIGCAVALGALGDALFQGQSLGANVALWAFAFTIALAALIRFGRLPWHQGRRWMVAPLLLFSLLFLWHDSRLLVAANLLAIAGAVAIGAVRRPHRAGVSEYSGSLVGAGRSTVTGPLHLLLKDVSWQEVGKTARGGPLLSVARGVAVGLPLLAVFGGLFAAADTVFKGYLTGALPGAGTPLRIALIVVWSWIAAGLLRNLVAEQASKPHAVERVPRLGEAEVLIVLGLLDLLFLAFVLVQARYLFGGHALVENRAHLTYATYARHGFFELVAACALALPVLLAADWLIGEARRRLFRIFGGILVGLLFVVIASALQRMRIYEQAYGLTQLRLYATGVILWLAVVLAWFAVTVLRGRRTIFALGAVVAAFAATLSLNILNPDALIARVNLDRPEADAQYLASLGDDAVPTLLRRLPGLDPPLRGQLARALLARSAQRVGVREWSLARRDAHRILAEHRTELVVFAGR
jgi:Domain of unknown function (DUF4153)